MQHLIWRFGRLSDQGKRVSYRHRQVGELVEPRLVSLSNHEDGASAGSATDLFQYDSAGSKKDGLLKKRRI